MGCRLTRSHWPAGFDKVCGRSASPHAIQDITRSWTLGPETHSILAVCYRSTRQCLGEQPLVRKCSYTVSSAVFRKVRYTSLYLHQGTNLLAQGCFCAKACSPLDVLLISLDDLCSLIQPAPALALPLSQLPITPVSSNPDQSGITLGCQAIGLLPR